MQTKPPVFPVRSASTTSLKDVNGQGTQSNGQANKLPPKAALSGTRVGFGTPEATRPPVTTPANASKIGPRASVNLAAVLGSRLKPVSSTVAPAETSPVQSLPMDANGVPKLPPALHLKTTDAKEGSLTLQVAPDLGHKLNEPMQRQLSLAMNRVASWAQPVVVDSLGDGQTKQVDFPIAISSSKREAMFLSVRFDAASKQVLAANCDVIKRDEGDRETAEKTAKKIDAAIAAQPPREDMVNLAEVGEKQAGAKPPLFPKDLFRAML